MLEVKVITDRQEMEDFVKQELTNKSKYDLNCKEAYTRMILNQEGWYYIDRSPCTCPNYGEDKGHNLTCGYYPKNYKKEQSQTVDKIPINKGRT